MAYHIKLYYGRTSWELYINITISNRCINTSILVGVCHKWFIVFHFQVGVCFGGPQQQSTVASLSCGCLGFTSVHWTSTTLIKFSPLKGSIFHFQVNFSTKYSTNCTLHKKQNKVHMNWISGTGTKHLLPLFYSAQNQLPNRVDRSDTAYMLLGTPLHKQTTCWSSIKWAIRVCFFPNQTGKFIALLNYISLNTQRRCYCNSRLDATAIVYFQAQEHKK